MAADKIATPLVAITETKKYRAGEYRGVFANTSTNYNARWTLSAEFKRFYSVKQNYSEIEQEKILEVLNEDQSSLARYDITKARAKNVAEWVKQNGQIKTLADIECIEGFTERNTKKLFKSILEDKPKTQNLSKKIRGQILQPNLSESVRQCCQSVLAVYITASSVCWAFINRSNYELQQWVYHGIDYPEGKKMQITDILDIAWKITSILPQADIYVTKAEATTLRASGNDPGNAKVLAVNLQKAQLVAMIVALINARHLDGNVSEDEAEIKQKVYFLRPTLPFRLYGTLVGNERVSTEQTVENLLQEVSRNEAKNQVKVPEHLCTMFQQQKDLQKDMLGHCLLMALTFMDICVYRNSDSINKLLKRSE
ncbi:unnamed protein product [Danaus chrysippus]|uniref:(African queen) hypothetical protein n=1 Tax=Danaus chrysippus TaxID=151541 RepID=A0A8J2QEV2_9NEOP|nr:unnamed protein product [Danaus chrysippus]